MTLLFNILMVLADGAFLILLARKRTVLSFIILLIGYGIISMLFCFSLAAGIFHFANLAAFAVFVHGTIIISVSALLFRKTFRGLALLLLLIVLSLVSVSIDAFFIEPHSLEVNRFTIHSKKISRPYKIVVLADIQTDCIGEYEQDVFRKTMDEQPDIIFFSGDYIQADNYKEHVLQIKKLNDMMRNARVSSSLGVFAVQGNIDKDDWTNIFDNLPVKYFVETERIDMEEISVTGLSIADSYQTDLSIPQAQKFHILLGHCPNFCLGKTNADLLIAGHTHGGQVQIPFIGPLMTLCKVPREWAAGGMHDSKNGGKIVISRGIGMERGTAPRMRFMCKPEIVVINLLPGD